MNKNIVCHFTSAHEYDDVRVFQKECVSLAKAGFEVYLVAPNAKSELVDGVHIVGVPSPSMNPLYRLFFLSRKIYKKTCKIDANIYHFHDIELFWFGLKLKKAGKRVIFDSHEDWPQYVNEITWLPSFFRRIFYKLLVHQYKHKLHKFDRVVTVSPHIASNMSLYSNCNIEIVTNYPILSSNLNTIERSDYTNRKNVLCYSGTVYRNTCQQEIIQAIQSIDNIEYKIIGKIDPQYKLTLKSYDIRNKVTFIDWVSKSELIELYKKSSIGIIIFEYSPNVGFKQGTMGNNKIFEYMYAGLPIVCTNFTLWNELIVDKYNCGISVRPKSVDNIREAIAILCENKNLAYEMGRNGQYAVFNEFNWDTQKQNLLKIYSDLLFK